MILRIAIDGASKGNGRDNCIGGAGVILYNMETNKVRKLQASEYGSTNQRAELLALLTAMRFISSISDRTDDDQYQIITDSEYIYNMFTKQWYDGWRNNDWRNKEGEKVKNRGLIENIVDIYECFDCITFYHIKGHVIPIGVVTANNMMEDKKSARLLYDYFQEKYEKIVYTRGELIKHAKELSVKNNGFMLDDELFKEFVVLNCVADVLASNAVLLANNPQGALDTSK